MNEFLKLSEAAKVIGVSVATLRAYESDGILPFEVGKTAKGHRRYPKAAIEAMKGTLPTRVPITPKRKASKL